MEAAGGTCMSLSFPSPGNASSPQLGRSVSIDQAAGLLGVSRRTIYNHIKSGRLETLRTIGGSQRGLVGGLPQAATRGGGAWAPGFALAEGVTAVAPPPRGASPGRYREGLIALRRLAALAP